jgi:[ribosomal protein S5]-alanine N-acetyltransferase
MNFKLRPWSLNDLDSLVKHANNHKIARFMTDQFPHPYYEENGRTFIEFASRTDPVSIMAIEVEEKAVGGIGLHPQHDVYRKNAEMGYWLAEPYWGNGIITSAIKQMVEYGFKNFDIERIFARPFGSNPASQKVLQKAGFVQEARFKNTIYKNGEFDDELVFAIRRM